jgi:UDP:flavonoid glycosyltransferase YjiC (YdhE family)
MRVLFTFAGGRGHLEPLLPLASAAAAAGHAVAFAARPWMVPKVEAAGFAVFPAGTNRGLTPERRPLLPVDMEREERGLREGFGRRIAGERAAAILAICTEWRPDVIVWEETDFGAVVAADRLGLPHACALVIAAGSFVRPDVVAAPLDELRAEYGLPADPELAGHSRYLVLSPFPPSLRDPAFPLPETARGVRLFGQELVAGEPPWQRRQNGVPAVYFTLGTVFNMESGDLFQRVLAGLAGLPVEVITTVGQDINPAELGPWPDNVQLHRFIPQNDLLPHVDLVVSHAGSGSVLGALAFGRPMLLIPMGADQPLNAGRCAALGVAQVLDPVAATPEMVRQAVITILATPTYHRVAAALAAEIAAMPDPAEAVRLLERLVGAIAKATKL